MGANDNDDDDKTNALGIAGNSLPERSSSSPPLLLLLLLVCEAHEP